MKITLITPDKLAKENDLLMALTFKAKKTQEKKTPTSHKKVSFEINQTIKELDKQLSGFFIDEAKQEGFIADESQLYVTSSLGKSKSKSIALLGMGDAHEQNVDLFRRIGGQAYKCAQQKQAKKIVIVASEHTTVPLFDVVQAITEGIYLSQYRFDKYKKKNKKENFVKEIDICLPTAPNAAQKSAITRGQTIAEGVCLARDLVNEGPMELNPQKFAEHAIAAAKECKIDIEVLDEKKLKKENMGLMLAVASAAQQAAPPRLIRLHYKPQKSNGKKIVLVGKGVTFDSGGLDIKTADGMIDMKIDMSGAATVFGTMHVIGKLKPHTEIIGYLGCVENGVGPHSYHPGDVLISRKGTSVEVVNTDAEGRLVLADTITYATDRDKPDIIIDIATLTGACMVALGLKTAGIFSNDDTLCESICQSGNTTGESFWRLPLQQELQEVIKSPIADIKNCGDRYGGSITAALFLQEFVEKNIKWAHLDIAGPATNTKPHSYLSHGGVGFGVRTLVDFLSGQK